MVSSCLFISLFNPIEVTFIEYEENLLQKYVVIGIKSLKYFFYFFIAIREMSHAHAM